MSYGLVYGLFGPCVATSIVLVAVKIFTRENDMPWWFALSPMIFWAALGVTWMLMSGVV
jgi:hypothetical protein